jgi:hypothetical protein
VRYDLPTAGPLVTMRIRGESKREFPQDIFVFEARRRSAERVRIFESSRNREEGLMRGCHAIEKLEIDILERWEMEKCNAEERI